MICQSITNNYDNVLVEYNVDISEMIKSPVDLPKDEVPLWLFISLKQDTDRKRNQLNYNTIHALIIEFDDGTSIEQFKSKYAKYKYALHTTSSHTKEHNKFRVILPLDQPYDYQLFKQKSVKTAMLDHFAGIDPSCFSNFQKIPVLPKIASEYQYHFNKGEIKFGYDCIESEVNRLIMIEKSNQAIKETMASINQKNMTPNLEAYKQKAFESIEDLARQVPSRATGNRYNMLVDLTARASNAQYPDGSYIFDDCEVELIVKRAYWDKAIAKLVDSFLKKR